MTVTGPIRRWLWGVEGRVPFLDKQFIDIAMNINPQDKMAGDGKMEKWVLRKAFEDTLPASVAWRQKEQFSDGVGYDWIDTLKEKVDKAVSDEQMAQKAYRYTINPPLSKEEYYYRTIFEEHFPSDAAAATVPSLPSVACSTPIVMEWDAAFANMPDPSGRAVKNVHNEGYE
jgi:asparagine synthase (glutamine-hydrolysing)